MNAMTILSVLIGWGVLHAQVGGQNLLADRDAMVECYVQYRLALRDWDLERLAQATVTDADSWRMLKAEVTAQRTSIEATREYLRKYEGWKGPNPHDPEGEKRLRDRVSQEFADGGLRINGDTAEQGSGIPRKFVKRDGRWRVDLRGDDDEQYTKIMESEAAEYVRLRQRILNTDEIRTEEDLRREMRGIVRRCALQAATQPSTRPTTGPTTGPTPRLF